MPDGLPTPLIVVLLLMPRVAVMLLALRGFIDGDAPGDSSVAVALTARRGPDRTEWYAEITVANHSIHEVVVLARAHPVGAVAAWLTTDDRSTALVHRHDLGRFEVLGATQAGAELTWLLPLPYSSTGTFRVVVVVEQGRRRTRVLRFTRNSGRAARAQAFSPLRACGEPKERR